MSSTNSVFLRAALSIGWAPLFVVVFHSALWRTIGHHSELDPFFHFLGGVAGAYSLLQALKLLPFLNAWLPWSRGVSIVSIVAIAAVTWELGEFASDLFLGTHIQQGWFDTASDLVLGIGGAVLAAWVARNRV